VVKHHNYRAGGEEEKRFKERVRKQMKHGCIIRGETHCHDHVTKLRNRGICQNAFDVVLLCCNQGSHQCGDRADPGND
jgi:hypothetical protein